jgi:hypothetical protein
VLFKPAHSSSKSAEIFLKTQPGMLLVTILQKLSATCAAELDLPNQLSTLGN